MPAISAAEATDAQAIRPRQRFLHPSNADCGRTREQSGFVVIGPRFESIRLMGEQSPANTR